MTTRPDRKPTTDHSMDTTKVQLGESMNLLGLPTVIWARVVEGAEMIQRHLYHQSPCQHG